MAQRSFLIYRPDGSSAPCPLSLPLIRIGRGEDNEIILEDPTRSISRFHAQLMLDPDGRSILTDLRSSNGTFVNEQILNGPVALGQDDVVRIGPYRLVFRDHITAAPKPAPPLPAFQIEAAAVELDQLQDRPHLLTPSVSGTAASTPQFLALELLHEVGVRLARTVTPADVAETSLDLLFKIAGVQRATLMSWDDSQQAFLPADLYTAGGKKMTDVTPASYDPRGLVLSQTILRKVRQENRPLHIRDARSHAEIGHSQSIIRAGIQAAFCSPLSFQGRFLGVLYADNLAAPDAFSQEDFRIFTTIAAQTGLALASAITRGQLLQREVEQAAMRLYLSPQVTDLISASGGGVELGGVLQPVTVLFADIRNFTQLSEQMDAREVVLMLNEFFTAMTQVIIDAGGTLDKYIGDCVMALFGAPLPAADDLDRAVQAAINMQRASTIPIGVGLHTGPAVIGNIGSTQRMQYTAIGDTVNVAARLVSLAAPGQIIVSEEVRNQAEGFFEPLGEVELKGRQRKMNVFSLLLK